MNQKGGFKIKIILFNFDIQIKLKANNMMQLN